MRLGAYVRLELRGFVSKPSVCNFEEVHKSEQTSFRTRQLIELVLLDEQLMIIIIKRYWYLTVSF
jgi:hypothetical protein